MGKNVILAPPGRDDFDVLSDSAAVVWALLEEPATVDEVVGTLVELYGVQEEQIADDVNALVITLLQKGVIEETTESNVEGSR